MASCVHAYMHVSFCVYMDCPVCVCVSLCAYVVCMDKKVVLRTIFSQLTNRCPTNENVSIQMSLYGDGLFANKAFTADTILFEEYPIGGTAIPFFNHMGNYCSNCVKPVSHDGYQCECLEAYCSESCKHWAHVLYHHILCTHTNSAYKQYYTSAKENEDEYLIIAARLLVMFPSAPWLFHYIHTEAEDGPDSADIPELADLLRNAIGLPSTSDSSYLPETLQMLRLNVLSLRYDETCVGFALYSRQSLMNHSNTPNCRCVTICGIDAPDNSCLCGIQATRDIYPGEELFIDYISPTDPRRSDILITQYGITS